MYIVSVAKANIVTLGYIGSLKILVATAYIVTVTRASNVTLGFISHFKILITENA